MNSATTGLARTMILIGVLATTTLISLAHTAPLSYATYGRNGLSTVARPEFLVLLDQRMPELENEMFSSSNDPESTVVRTKRIGPLSIVNPVDVLRQRVFLEYARRKAMQDQRQVDTNRQLLESVGKRSASNVDLDLAKLAAARSDYAIRQRIQDHRDRATTSDRIPERMQNWYEVDDPIFPERQDDRTHRTQTNELHLL